MIMRGGTARSLGGLWLLAVLGLAGILLPLGATSARPTQQRGDGEVAANDRNDGNQPPVGGEEKKGKGKAKGQSKDKDEAYRGGSSELNLAKLKLKVEEAKVKVEEAKARFEQRLAEYNAAAAAAKATPKKTVADFIVEGKGKGKGKGKSDPRLDDIERRLESLLEEIQALRKTDKKKKKD